MNDLRDETVETDHTLPHLKPMPWETVTAICTRIAGLMTALETTVVGSDYMRTAILREAGPFTVTRTPHDGKRLADALNYVAKELCRQSEPGASGMAQQVASDIEAAIADRGGK